MSFWDKILKKDKKCESTTTQAVMEKITVNKVTADNEQNVVTKQYSFQFSLTDENLRKRIMEFIRPIKTMSEVLNLQLAYGIWEEENQLFITRMKCSQQHDSNTVEIFHTTHFVVLHDEKIFEASYTSNNIKAEGILTYQIPKEYEVLLKQAFDFWRNWAGHKQFEQECNVSGKEVSVNKLNGEYCKPLFNELKEYQAETERLKKQQKQHFEIHCEEDAKHLFFLCKTDCRRNMIENYDEATVEAFNSYADSEKKKAWIMEECGQILTDIIQGDREKIYDKLEKVNGRCSYWLGSASEALVPLYTKACKVLFESDEKRFVVCISSFLSHLKNSTHPETAKELLDMTEYYYKKEYPQEYESGSIASHPQKFKQICCELRGRMAELSPIENNNGFRFVLTTQEKLRQIVLWYRNKYNDDAAVKESVAELNCAYGVQNEKLFLTALSEASDRMMNQSWDRFSFVAVMQETGEVMELRCKREAEDGGFVLDYCAGTVKEHWELIKDAIAFYRNQPERKAFFDTYEQEHEENISDLKTKAHKGLLSKFKRHYEKEYKRIGNNPLSTSLKNMIDLCEEKGAQYGYKNTVIGKPVTEDEITEWEQQHNMRLPEEYKHFLSFANGVCFLGDSERIFGLAQIGQDNEYLEPDYIHIGNMIGDGTMICLSKVDGHVYIADHGEYDDRGDFGRFLEWFVEFLEGV